MKPEKGEQILSISIGNLVRCVKLRVMYTHGNTEQLFGLHATCSGVQHGLYNFSMYGVGRPGPVSFDTACSHSVH